MDYTKIPALAGGYGNMSGLLGDQRNEQQRPIPPRIENRGSNSPLRTHPFSPRGELLTDSPVILMTPAAYQKQCVYIDLAPKEVGWMGSVALLNSGNFLIEDTYLLEQQVTEVETELSKDGIEKLSVELIETYPDGVKLVNRMRFWGHSHVFMGTGPSGTDESTMMRIGAEGTGINWYIRGIFNKHGRAEFTLYLFELGFRINDAPWAVFNPETGRIIDTPKKTFFPRMQSAPAKQSFTIIPVESGKATGERSAMETPTTAQQKDSPPKTDALAPESTTRTVKAETVAAGGEKPAVDAGKKKAEPARDIFAGFPEILTPSKELRAAIKAEYKQKVKERRPSFWFGATADDKDTDEPENQDQPVVGDSKEGKDLTAKTDRKSAGETAAITGDPESLSAEPEEVTDGPPNVGKSGANASETESLGQKAKRILLEMFS